MNVVGKDIAHRLVQAFGAAGDVAAVVDVHQQPPGLAVAHAAFGNRLVQMFDVGGQRDEFGILSLQAQQVLGHGTIGQPPLLRAAVPGIEIDHVGHADFAGKLDQRLDVVEVVVHQHADHVHAVAAVGPMSCGTSSKARTARSQAPGGPAGRRAGPDRGSPPKRISPADPPGEYRGRPSRRRTSRW